MSPKRPISTQRTDLHTDRHTDLHTGATADRTPAKQPKHSSDDAAKAGSGRDAGPSHDTGVDDADDVAAASPTHAGRVAPDLTHRVGAAGNEASATITGAAARVLGTHETATDVFDPSSKLDARAGRATAEREGLRDRARHGVQDDAADGDGTTGIVDQGHHAVAEEPELVGLIPGSVPAGEEASFEEAEREFQAELAKGDADTATAQELFEAELGRLNELAAAKTKAEAEGNTFEETPGGHKVTHPDGKVDIFHRDGTFVVRQGSTTYIDKDHKITEQRTDDDGTTTVTEHDGDNTTVTVVDKRSVDPEHQHDLDPSKAHLTGLDDFLDDLHGTTVAGGGNTDPVDDDGFGSGAVISSPAVVGAAGNSLLTGGDTRGSEIGSGGAGHLPVDVGGHAGAVDAGPDADPGFGGGGLEDDPFDHGPGPSLGLDGARAGATADDDTDDDADTDTDDADADV